MPIWSTKKQVPLSECNFSVHTTEIGTAEVLTYYERIRGYLQHEDGLINSRLTWSLSIHGFLFATFGILAGKVVDILMAKKPFYGGASGLLGLEILVALVGALVAHHSRAAIIAAHKALQHLATVVHQLGILQIPPAQTSTPAAIVPGIQTIAPASMMGIGVGVRLLVGEEVVTVTAATVNSYTATFATGHAANTRITPLGTFVLPKINSGGASDAVTSGADRYYTMVPLFLMIVWMALAVFSGIVVLLLLYRPQYFPY